MQVKIIRFECIIEDIILRAYMKHVQPCLTDKLESAGYIAMIN